MSLENMKTPDKAYAKTKVTVLRLIQQKLSAGEDRLPSGEEMARMCGVSLVLIRDVLGELESRGYVSRRRGKGILINDHISGSYTHLDVYKRQGWRQAARRR